MLKCEWNIDAFRLLIYHFSCRGVRASYSFSFLEVIVSCEVANNEPSLEKIYDDSDTQGEKTIYLHLKKFFRGARFASQPFLRSLQGKHRLGELVCVSGKVSSFSFILFQNCSANILDNALFCSKSNAWTMVDMYRLNFIVIYVAICNN